MNNAFSRPVILGLVPRISGSKDHRVTPGEDTKSEGVHP
jgi:hypothetical protein